MANRVYEWVDERTGIKPALDYVMYRRLPKSVNWFFTLGSASLTVFIIQAISGAFLAMGYTPSTAPVETANGISNEALESVRYLTGEGISNIGYWVRGFHHYGANAMVIVVVLHMLRVFFMGSYKYPRELTWFTGVFILLLVLGFSFTGYLLPWDNRAYWATQVGVKIGGSAPILGPSIETILKGGPTLGAATLTRFYALHVLLLPALTAGLIGVHLFLIVKIGISGMPKSREKEQVSGEFFESAKLNGKKTGKAFFPYIIFKDAVVSFVVLLAIVAMILIKPIESSNPVDVNNPVSTITDQRGNPIMHNGQANQLQPQPEWYFLFLFQALKYLPPEVVNINGFKISGEAVGGIIIPTILLGILLLVPYLDRGPKRNPLNRPWATLTMLAALVAVVVLTLLASSDLAKAQAVAAKPAAAPAANGGAAPASATTAVASATTAAAASSGGSSGGPAVAGNATTGLRVFNASQCGTCHTNGGRVAGIGPKLADTTRDEAYIRNILRNGKGAMPAYSTQQVNDQQLEDLVAYVKGLK